MTIERASRAVVDRIMAIRALPIALLYLIGLALNFSLARQANLQGVLTAEEASVTFRDIVFLELHQRYSLFDTNLGGHAIFWLGSKLHPAMHIFYGRDVKAVAMAMAGPVVFLLARRLGLSREASFLAGLLIILMPGLNAFSWLGIEAGLDTILGALALYWAMDSRPARWLLTGAAAGFALTVYPAAIAFLPSILLLIGTEVWRNRANWAKPGWAILSGLFYILMVLVPAAWWGTFHHSYGGGGWDATVGFVYRTMHFAQDVLTQPRSYYFFSVFPAMGGVILLPLIACGLYLSARDGRRWWPIWLLCASTVIVNYMAGGLPGFRRMLPLTLVAALLLGRVAEAVLTGEITVWMRRAGISAMTAAVILLAGQTAVNARALGAGTLDLPNDFDWPTDWRTLVGGRNIAEVRARVMSLRKPARAMCILHMLRGDEIFTLDDIRTFYWNKDPEHFETMNL